MSTGKIQFAEQNGSFVLKFVGEVRLTLCSALIPPSKDLRCAEFFGDHHRSYGNPEHR